MRLRIEGSRVALPGLTLTPYLVGLLVMLGMLGTFLGMVVTFKGAVFALEGSTDLLAIRSALAEPIKGLALAFGTSVAGVAASAMLGLMSAISRRERLEVARQLDTQIAAVLRPFSLVHQRQETYKALQLQARALPGVAGQLGALMEQMERRNQQLDEQLLQRQEQFHREVSVAYTDLARSVQHSLGESLSASARVAGESLGPVVESAMRASQHVSQTLNDVTQLVNQSEGMIRSRMESESTWIQAQGDRMDQLATVWRTELQALRDEEATRAQAAVARLDELQGSVASHLATLGSALEAPLTRLLQTAAEVPQAASEVIGQLRQEMSNLTARDNVALEERTAIMGQMNTLLQSVNQASSQQQAMIESLVTSAAAVLEKAGNQLSESLGAQAGKVAEVAEHVTSSAIELSSLSESFSHGVALFSDSNDKLVNSLQTIEGSIKQSLTRSDEQLAYYVAQAREVIDLSITSQQGIVEDLRKLHSKQAANAEGAAR